MSGSPSPRRGRAGGRGSRRHASVPGPRRRRARGSDGRAHRCAAGGSRRARARGGVRAVAADGTPDHRAVAKALGGALADGGADGGPEVWGYEGWTPLVPNRIVEITSVIERKREALAAHRTASLALDLSAGEGLGGGAVCRLWGAGAGRRRSSGPRRTSTERWRRSSERLIAQAPLDRRREREDALDRLAVLLLPLVGPRRAQGGGRGRCRGRPRTPRSRGRRRGPGHRKSSPPSPRARPPGPHRRLRASARIDALAAVQGGLVLAMY